MLNRCIFTKFQKDAKASVMNFQDLKTEAKKLSVLFTLAAGVTTGGVIGGGVLIHQFNDPAVKIEQVDTTRFRALNDNKTVVEAEVIQTAADGAVIVRAHSWVGQYIVASVYPAGTENASLTASFTDEKGAALASVAKGQKVFLRNLSGKGFAGMAVDLPNVKPSGDVVAGPIQAEVLRVIDGDTPAVMAQIWPGNYVSISVRQYGIDTPEKGGRAKNAYEAQLAEQASAATRALIEGKQVLLYNVEIDKFGGRVLADIKTLDGIDVGENLTGKGLARPYFGDKKQDWNPPPGWKAPEKAPTHKPKR